MKGYDVLGPDIDRSAGVAQCGSEALYNELCGDFYQEIPRKAEMIERLAREGDVKEYTVEVHSLKSSARLIGASHLSQMALELETFGHHGELEAIRAGTGALLEYYRSFQELLASFSPQKESGEKRAAGAGEVKTLLAGLIAALRDFDIDAASSLIGQLEGVALPPEQETQLSVLSQLVGEIEYEQAAAAAQEMLAGVS